MWFKNLQLYRFTKPFTLEVEQFERDLVHHRFTPCASQDLSRIGWDLPLGKGTEMLSHWADGQLLICAKKESKLLPASVIRDEMQELQEQLEHEHGRSLKKKEKEALKEEVTQRLLPRAFCRSERLFAWINLEQQLIAVDCASSKKAEELLSLLRKSLGSVPATPLTPSQSAEVIMTDWLKSASLPNGFSIEDEAELRAMDDEGGIIRCRRQELDSQEILNHLEAGKWVTKLALNWRDTLSFVLTEDLGLRRLKFSEEFKERQEELEDPIARFDADFALMTGELSQFLTDLLAVFSETPSSPMTTETSTGVNELPW